jgi:hypothetical protein
LASGRSVDEEARLGVAAANRVLILDALSGFEPQKAPHHFGWWAG